MALMRGEPLLAKLAFVARYVVLPGAMAAALLYSPQQDANNKEESKKFQQLGEHVLEEMNV